MPPTRNAAPALLAAFTAVTTTLSKIPEPISAIVISTLEEVLKAVQQTYDNRNQLHLLFIRTCDILQSLGVPQSFTDDSLLKSTDQLIQNLENIRDFALSTKSKNFFKSMIQADDIRFKIEELERRLWSSCLSFQNSALITANKKLDDLWELAANSDKNRISAEQLHQAQLRDQSEQLQRIQSVLESLAKPSPDHRPLDTLLETLDVNPVVTMTGMSALLERHELGRIALRDEEVKFLRAGIRRLKEQSSTMSAAKVKPWTVTSFEVEKGFLIGWDTTCFVRTARWLGKRVGLVEVVDEETVRHFVKLWKNLRSIQIQGLLGASTVDQPTFLLVPHPNVGIVEYVKNRHIKRKCIQLFLEAARALEYLHTRDPPVVHSGLCNTTITVDEEGKVSLSCVGITPEHLALSREQRDTLYRDLSRWHAPEVRDQSLRTFTLASDIYSLGVVFSELLNVVEDRSHLISPQDRALVRDLIQQCTNKDPSHRPSVSVVTERLQANRTNILATDMLATLPNARDALPDGLENVDRWRVAYFSTRSIRYVDQDDAVRYVSSAPLPGSSDRPLRQLCIEVECHDQGRENTSAHQRDGAWAWVELSLLREKSDGTGERYEVDLAEELKGHPRGWMVADTRYEILRCPFADSTPRVHRITLDHRNPFVKCARKGDVVVINPTARFPGWWITMYSAEMQVVTE